VLLAVGVEVASGTEEAVATVGREWLWAAGQRSGEMSASGAARDCVDDGPWKSAKMRSSSSPCMSRLAARVRRT